MPGVRHAQWCLDQHLADKRNNKLIKAMDNPKWTERPKHKKPVRHIKSQYEPESLVFSQECQPLRVRSRQQLQLRSDEEIIDDDPAIGMNGTRFRRR
jgi:hypothetical protein